MSTPYPELARDRIKTTLLIEKLQDHIFDAEKTPMTRTQVTAAIALIKKTVPDLANVDMTIAGDKTRPILLQASDAGL